MRQEIAKISDNFLFLFTFIRSFNNSIASVLAGEWGESRWNRENDSDRDNDGNKNRIASLILIEFPILRPTPTLSLLNENETCATDFLGTKYDTRVFDYAKLLHTNGLNYFLTEYFAKRWKCIMHIAHTNTGKKKKKNQAKKKRRKKWGLMQAMQLKELRATWLIYSVEEHIHKLIYMMNTFVVLKELLSLMLSYRLNNLPNKARAWWCFCAHSTLFRYPNNTIVGFIESHFKHHNQIEFVTINTLYTLWVVCMAFNKQAVSI